MKQNKLLKKEIYRYGRVTPSSRINIAEGLTLHSPINTAGRSNSTSPWITTSLCPCDSLTEQPEANFFPNILEASLIFKSATVSRPATTVQNFFFWRCTRVMMTLGSNTVVFFRAAAPPPFFFSFFFSPPYDSVLILILPNIS